MQVGTEDPVFPLENVRHSRDVFMAAGFEFELKEIAGHDHNYYGISDQVNGTAWEFLKSKKLTPQKIEQKEITLPKETLAQYAGTYEMAPRVYMTITLDGEQLISQIAGQGKVRLFAGEDRKFFLKVVDAKLEFVKEENGKITELILRQNGITRPLKRLDEAEAKRASDEEAARTALVALAAQRYKEQKAAPGGEEALRRDIEEMRAGEPKYDQMSARLAQTTRQQLPQIKALLARMGSVQAVTFKGVGPGGMDIYEVKFENGLTEWRIMLTPDGKIDGLNYRLF